ncbi:AFR677Cp [Eremothecium gossypii ATCC 10895]|uniref:AFR677Cp n=1 Tax=Eremothecium gossypii (strain ATCC 10895 / CBS 109.51 / FGSC 9923 / NRRL Y-1056) TaxID=284811 RepID=Q751Z8_EREGS|nr:AFR677Cp [Eremothecium gossypii ATCC 10895]AAS54049.2 AFR677Cp [Eremothecium gossypii ATCC 10895]AEY98364.1 FAFR677Cp [Eremothecium gossypii FDAG1]
MLGSGEEHNASKHEGSSDSQPFDEERADSMCEKRRRFPPLGAGIACDVRDRLPQYWSDWTDAWDYRVIPAALETYFSNLLPALAFAQDMFDHTNNAFGVNEVLLSSALAALVFGVLGGQPLCIVGVTGPISVFNYTLYDIVKPLGVDYFGFMFWVCIWATVCHLALAVTNMVCLLQYVSAFPCDIFGLFINIVYLQKGVDILVKQFQTKEGFDAAAGFASVTIALCMAIFGTAGKLFTETPLLTHAMRTFVSDYSTVLSVVFWTGFTHFGGALGAVDLLHLPVSTPFQPTSETRDQSTWLAYVPIAPRYAFLALPFGIILTILFYFDHSVSSLMAQRTHYRLRKASTFHYDFALLSVTTAVAGVLGIPAPNGLIPQAPMHTESLLVRDRHGTVIRCVEQRVTNSLQGLLFLGTMTRPLLHCLGLIPQAVLSALFFIMAFNGLYNNAILRKILWLLTDPRRRDPENPLNAVPLRPLAIFTALATFCALVEFVLTLSKAAIAFPVALLATVLLSLLFPRFFQREHLRILDPPVAEEFTMKNLLLENLT